MASNYLARVNASQNYGPCDFPTSSNAAYYIPLPSGTHTLLESTTYQLHVLRQYQKGLVGLFVLLPANPYCPYLGSKWFAGICPLHCLSVVAQVLLRFYGRQTRADNHE